MRPSTPLQRELDRLAIEVGNLEVVIIELRVAMLLALAIMPVAAALVVFALAVTP